MDRRAFLIATAATVAGWTTAFAETVALNVPIYRQQHALTCESAALRMALGALSVNVTEADILQRLAVDPTPRQVFDDGSVVWGDPDVGFVGSFDGLYAVDGYGVYPGPIADVAQSFGIGATPLHGTDPQTVYDAVGQGMPVLVWVPYALTVRGFGEWTTPTGKLVPYVVTEHCVVLSGLTDSAV